METADHRKPRKRKTRVMSPLLWYRLHMELFTGWWEQQDETLRDWLLASAALLMILSALVVVMFQE